MTRSIVCLSRRFLGFAACSTLLTFAQAQAAPTPAKDPVLRIETGGHLANITRVSTDSAGRWLVTASEDKTARLWDARTGQALGVMRPPIGSESVGALYAAAMSPDGKTVALGGNSNFGDNTHVLHLFDRSSNSVPPKSTMAGLEAPITQLTWSADNQLIAVGLRQEGLRVFRRNLQFVGADPEYNEAIFGADFSSDGRLAVASLDGFIRIYRLGGKNGLDRLGRVAAPGGKPYAIAFSPDGRTLAVGYQDKARVDLLDVATMNPGHRIDLGAGNLGRVAWSPDGSTLFAAGGYVRNGRFPVLAFGNRGTAPGVDVGGFSNTVLSLAALAGGNVAAASAEPSWALFSAQGQRLTGSDPQSADFRDSGANFRVSADGSLVAFQYRAGEPNHVFDLASGSLKAVAAPEKALAPIQSGAPNVDNWKNSTAPRVGGRALALKPGEVSRSLAILAGDQSVVLGTEWFVRRYSKDGTPLWERRVTSPAWAVNVSSNGRWVVAGLGDGSIRWLRASDGAEQLAMFPHTDKTRWIAWTPSGYYDTSVGGENLVGWHLNRAFNQSADFFSAGRFRDKLYRSDVIQKVLSAGDEMEAFKQAQADLAEFEAANAEPTPASGTKKAIIEEKPRKPAATVVTAAPKLLEIVPPIIELQSDNVVEAKGDVVTVKYAVRTPADAPVRDIKVRVNGRLDRSIKPVLPRGVSELPPQEVQVRLPPGKEAEVLLIAENKNAKSDPVSIKVTRPAASTMPPAQDKPDYDTLYMLVVAVGKYQTNPLKVPVADANAFKSQMARIANPPPGARKIYNKLEFHFLTDEQATKESILKELDWLKANVKENDAGVLFLAGHGVVDTKKTKSYYYVPYKADAQAAKAEDMVPGDKIVSTLQSLPGTALFFLDTCHSGALSNQKSDTTDIVNKIDDERGVTIFASSTGKEESLEDDSNGLFTKAIIEGLQGKAADPQDRMVYPSLLKRYVTRRVIELSENAQRPFISDRSIDKPLAIVIK